ncbi:MAG: alpha-L-arabinofuranosidase [Clostridia bacterium]|nr:alpha-L-arabinofuranosidase [Clostridia bacterium]
MKVTITDKKGCKVNPNMIGLFFEDINYGADGGVYAEMLENRSFDFFPTKINEGNSPLIAWSKVGNAEFTSQTKEPLNEVNVQYAHIAGKNGEGIKNRGFDGIFVEEGKKYDFSAYLKGNAKLKIEIKSGDKTLCEEILESKGDAWAKKSCVLIATETACDGELYITFLEDGAADIDMTSLFPQETFKGRKNGLRRDLAQVLHDLKPGFMRFPGGCIVEGNGLENRYKWKETVGDIETRKCNWNRWQDADVGIFAPEYYQSYGLGFYEYFILCEDLGCEPLPVLNCGMGCQYQCKEAADDLTEYIKDALDLIEFANGDSEKSEWAHLRAKMGHPEPFGLKYLAIGNEQWEEVYFERYEKFAAVLSEKHPQIKLVTSSGPEPDGEKFDKAKAWLSDKDENFAYMVDEHYYVKPEWAFKHTDRYDNYDRTKTKVFAGEYACHIGDNQPKPNNLLAALGEAAMMTGFERNADVVRFASYAPLFAKDGYSQWTPDLIFFNNHDLYLTPSYYVQSLFAHNLPTFTVGLEREEDGDVFMSAGYDEKTNEYILKIVNKGGKKDIVLTVPIEAESVTETVLTGETLDAANSFEDKMRVCPKEIVRKVGGHEIALTAEKYSFTVIKIK